jgi:DNA-binding PadR family transcriptional regulator
MDPDSPFGGWWRAARSGQGPWPGSGHGPHGRGHGHRSHGHGFGFGPGSGFGPGEPGDAPGPGFGPGSGPGFPFGPGFGPGPWSDPAARHRRRGWGRGRASRGDVRTAVLLLLAEEPMHGYQLMHAIADRSGGRWTPSPGAIYPTLSQLEDEGLVTVTADAGRKLATLTGTGRAAVEELHAAGNDPFAGAPGAAAGPDVRGLLEELHGAVRQVARTGTDAQLAAAGEVLAQARRSLYLLLADGPDGPPSPPEPPSPPSPPGD